MKRIEMNNPAALMMATLLTVSLSPAWAQGDMNHQSMPASTDAEMEDMDFSGMKMSDMEQPMDHSMDHGKNGMMQGSMQGGSAPADARDPHAYSDGYDFGPIPRPRLADEQNFASLLVDRLEATRSDDNTTVAYDLQAWYGRDYDRVVLKAEGEANSGKLEEADSELLWSHAVATFWNTQLGLRYESSEEGPDRSWLAFGFQGLAPYWFELDVTAYLGENGQSALGLEVEYELLFTQKLILQPRLEANIYGKNDPKLARGSGLSNITAGLRLRYEIRREFAPYIGIEWAGKFGDTADYARAAGESEDETRGVAGVRFWF
ncbi:MAG: copper resistance protein B [Candidatus Polarisedimenticolaceae bacterium]|nr:copper resistance protein B [Candidatus Polarisedimenticolaceae bacterium]